MDEGYEGSLIPIEINIGDKVLSALRENTQMEWVFTTEEKATSGVKSGKYYAAIVIPKGRKTGDYLLFQCQGKCDCTEGNR